MSEQISIHLETNKSKSCLVKPDPVQVHQSWHLLFLSAGILVLVAVIVNDIFVEHWFSPDGHITEEGRNNLNVLRLGLVLISGGCILLWTFRKNITIDFLEAVDQWRNSSSQVGIATIVPSTQPEGLQRVLWLILLFWIAGLTISLIPGYDTFAARWTVENGVFENLTVLCYLFAGFISLRLATPYLRRNSLKGLNRWFFLGMVACFLFVAMEETNWGELYFQYKVAEFIRLGNYQGEVSLHNISLPFFGKYWANDLLRIIAFCGGVVLPVMICFSKFFRRLVSATEAPLPPWLSQAYFFVAALIPHDNVQLQRHNMPSELREITIAVGVAIWLWTIKRGCRNVCR